MLSVLILTTVIVDNPCGSVKVDPMYGDEPWRVRTDDTLLITILWGFIATCDIL